MKLSGVRAQPDQIGAAKSLEFGGAHYTHQLSPLEIGVKVDFMAHELGIREFRCERRAVGGE